MGPCLLGSSWGTQHLTLPLARALAGLQCRASGAVVLPQLAAPARGRRAASSLAALGAV